MYIICIYIYTRIYTYTYIFDGNKTNGVLLRYCKTNPVINT